MLDALSIEQYKQFHPLFEKDVNEAISLQKCVESRISAGGTTQASAEEQINYIEQFI